MFYWCAKLNAFKLPNSTEYSPSGGVIAASAMPCGMLKRRSMMPYPHLRHRLFDPQLYLAGLDVRVCEKTVFKLATYPWFGVNLAEYDSTAHQTHQHYKQQMQANVAKKWLSKAPQDTQAISKCVAMALQFQINLGCEVLIAPSPLTSMNNGYTTEVKYLDAASQFVRDNHITTPLLGTVAISDGMLKGIDPLQNSLLQVITSHIAAREELSGAYLVLEQTADTGYVCTNEDTLLSLLIIVDDICQGANKRVVTNYLGHFGLVLTAAGAETWTSGYYRSQRRMRLSDQEEQDGRAYPHLFSDTLSGNIGLEKDLPLLYSKGLLKKILNRTKASDSLFRSLQATGGIDAAPAWAYKPGTVTAASAHYLDVCSKMDAFADSKRTNEKLDAVQRWLQFATELAAEVKAAGASSTHTDIRHQEVWLSAFHKWKSYSAG